MASEKVSNMPAASVLNDVDLFMIAQTGVSKKLTALQLNTLLSKVRSAAILGTLTNDNAAAGKIGEVITDEVLAGIAIPDSTPTEIARVTLTPGDWEITGMLNLGCVGFTSSELYAGYEDTDLSNFPNDELDYTHLLPGATGWNSPLSFPCPTRRRKVAAATTLDVLLFAYVGIGAGTVTGYGFISARRMR